MNLAVETGPEEGPVQVLFKFSPSWKNLRALSVWSCYLNKHSECEPCCSNRPRRRTSPSSIQVQSTLRELESIKCLILLSKHAQWKLTLLSRQAQKKDQFKFCSSSVQVESVKRLTLLSKQIQWMLTLLSTQAQKKDQSKFYGDLLEKRRTDAEKEQEK